MSLLPAGACIPVASVSLIHVFAIHKHCGTYKHNIIHVSLIEAIEVNEATEVTKPISVAACLSLLKQCLAL